MPVETRPSMADNDTMEVRIRRVRCCGSGQCAEAAPEVFAVDDAGKAVVVDPEALSLDVLQDVAAACPCQAIEVEDDDGSRYP
jgi:ferredoxin